MRNPFPLAVLAVAASGCLGGTAGGTAPQIVTVPDVVHPGGEPRTIGISADQAGAALHHANLRLAIRAPFQFGSFWGEPLVMRQSPAAGVRVPAGTPVALVVEQDRGTAVCASGRRTMPDVVDTTLTQAERALGEIAYGGTVPPLPPSGVTRWEDAYLVSAQSIPAGTRVAPCTSVRLRVRLA
jgi:beta-lactam-binding protein with PASTA domain